MFMNSLHTDYALSSQGRMQLADCTASVRRNATFRPCALVATDGVTNTP